MNEEMLEVVFKRRNIRVGDKVRVNKPNDPWHYAYGKVTGICSNAFQVDINGYKQFFLEKRLVRI